MSGEIEGAAAGGGGGGGEQVSYTYKDAQIACLKRSNLRWTFGSNSSALLGVKDCGDVEAVLKGLPGVDGSVVDAIVAAVGVKLDSLGGPPKASVEKAKYHHFIGGVLDVVDRITCTKTLRRFKKETSVARDGRGLRPTPDFSYTSIREGVVTFESLLVSVEVECFGKMEQACKEAAANGFGRLAELLDVYQDLVLAQECKSFAIATDGTTLQIIQAVPCDEPPLCSPRLSLWTDDGSPNRDTFAALARLLSASPTMLGSIDTPLDQCRVVTGLEETEAGMKAVKATMVGLGERIGRGGCADVYSATWEEAAVVVKRARSRKTRTYLVMEWKTLHKLIGCDSIPTIVAPPRVHEETTTIEESIEAIVMTHKGESLRAYVDRVGEVGNWSTFASLTCQCVLDALCFAHEKGYAHLDIRPNNVVFEEVSAEDGAAPRMHAVLVDWGLSQKLGNSDNKGVRGRVEFASDVQFDAGEDGWVCSRDMDLESVAYLYAAIAVGHGAAPWGEIEDLAKESRDEWVTNRDNHGSPAIRFLARVQKWRDEGRPDPIPEHLYRFSEETSVEE